MYSRSDEKILCQRFIVLIRPRSKLKPTDRLCRDVMRWSVILPFVSSVASGPSSICPLSPVLTSPATHTHAARFSMVVCPGDLCQRAEEGKRRRRLRHEHTMRVTRRGYGNASMTDISPGYAVEWYHSEASDNCSLSLSGDNLAPGLTDQRLRMLGLQFTMRALQHLGYGASAATG